VTGPMTGVVVAAWPRIYAQESRAIETAIEIGADCITVSEQRLGRHRGALDEARALGIDIWLEVRRTIQASRCRRMSTAPW
jgi:hypothetical protein